MNNQNDKHTRLERRKKRKEDRFLNILIAAVVIAIVVIAFIVLPGDKEKSKEEQVKEDDQEIIEPEDEQEDLNEPEKDATEREEEQSEADDIEEDENNEEPADVEVTEDPDDPVVAKSIVDPAWSPIGTNQQGEHVSLYDGDSVDWQEKVQALTYTTGLPEDDMIVWRLKNGGSPQKSIGIVSSKDKTEKYRVYLEWVDGEGWQPVKMDLLETLDFDY